MTESANNRDYLRPVREAADRVADEVDYLSRVEMKAALIEFAGAILDAARAETAEAIRDANQMARARASMARSLE